MIDLSAIRGATPAEMPIIDLFRYDEESETDQRRLGDAIVGALRTSGFFVRVRRDVIRGAFAAAREFHALAPERKPSSPWNRALSATWRRATTQ